MSKNKYQIKMTKYKATHAQTVTQMKINMIAQKQIIWINIIINYKMMILKYLP